MSITTILIATDFSKTAERATRAGALLALATGARVVLFHAAPPVALGRATPFFPVELERSDIEEVVRSEARDKLRQVRDEVLWNVERVAVVEAPAANAAAAINDAADHYLADLVVVGTHALRGLARLVAGSTAERVARDCRRPVLVVTPDASIDGVLPTRIVVGVDLSSASVAALRWAGSWAQATRAPLTVFHVSVPSRPLGPGDALDAPWIEHGDHLEIADAQRSLRQLVAQHVPAGVAASIEVRAAGDAPSALGSRAAGSHDLVVVGSGRRHRGWWFASTAQRVVRRSPAPVVVVPDARAGRDQRPSADVEGWSLTT